MAVAGRDNLTRQIRDAVDIVDLVGNYLALRRSGASFKGLCPFHEEKTPSFTVHPVRQTFKCYGCGAGGDVYTFVMLKEHVEFPEARRILAERAGIDLSHESGLTRSGPGKTDLARVNEWAKRVFRKNYQGPNGQAAREYVAGRKISPAMCEAFGLGLAVDSMDSLIRQAGTAKIDLKLLVAAGLAKESQRGGYYDTFRHRLMFPIADPTGRVLGFGGRTLGDDPAKYLNTPATALFDKSAQLFGLDRAREGIERAGRAIVVEGYTDCIMAHQFGFTETVATLGTAMTEGHARLLRRYTDRVILLFDSDEAGQRAADRALAVTLATGLDVALTRVPEGKDPCDYLLSAGADGFNSVLKATVGALEFKWRQVAREYQASATGPGRKRAIDAYLQQLAQWIGQGAIDQVQMGLLLNQLCGILAVPAEDLQRQLRGMVKRRGQRVPAGVSADGTSSDHRPINQPSSARQEALRQIVEMLLNAPEHYPAVASYLDPSAIDDAALSAVAGELVKMLESGEPFRLTELIGRFESPAFGRLITELQARGELRGKYEAVIAGAAACLQAHQRLDEEARLAEAIRSRTMGEGSDPQVESSRAEQDEKLIALTANRLSAGQQEQRFLTARAGKRYLSR